MESIFKLRDYQERLSNDAAETLHRKKLVCLFMEVRTGKTITALETCKKVNAKKCKLLWKYNKIYWLCA